MTAITDQIKHMEAELKTAITSRRLTYDDTKQITVCGIYFVYKDDQVLYVGKTSREGKTRFQEMAADYRSHTLNRKLLRPLLNQKLNTNYERLTRDIKHQLVNGGIITLENFEGLQREVNNIIRTELQFQFYPTKSENLTRFEYFAISVLNPPMND